MRKILITAILVFSHCVTVQQAMFYKKTTLLRHPDDDSNETLTLVTWDDDINGHRQCEMFTTDQKLNQEVKTSGMELVHRPSKEEMQGIEVECNSLRRRRDTLEEEEGDDTVADKEMVSSASNKWYLIYPGTKWCGAGNVAENDADLGAEADTDACCRAHDMCDDIIPVGETKHGLTNDGKYTALSCKCDQNFYNCLSRVNSVTSNSIGNLYFNILRSRCFKKDYPQTDQCRKYATKLKLICLEYEKDTSKPKVYQWYPAKVYKQLPNIDPSTHKIPF